MINHIKNIINSEKFINSRWEVSSFKKAKEVFSALAEKCYLQSEHKHLGENRNCFMQVKSIKYPELNVKASGFIFNKRQVRKVFVDPGYEAIRQTFLDVIKAEFGDKDVASLVKKRKFCIKFGKDFGKDYEITLKFIKGEFTKDEIDEHFASMYAYSQQAITLVKNHLDKKICKNFFDEWVYEDEELVSVYWFTNRITKPTRNVIQLISFEEFNEAIESSFKKAKESKAA